MGPIPGGGETVWVQHMSTRVQQLEGPLGALSTQQQQQRGASRCPTLILGQSVGMPGPWWFFHHFRSSCSSMAISVWWSSLYTAFTLAHGQGSEHRDTFSPPPGGSHLSLLVMSRCLWMERKACFRKLILFLSSSCDSSKMASISSM